MHANEYAMSYPAAMGGTITQGHADYCAAHGHATLTSDGAVAEFCPRCGDVLSPEMPAYTVRVLWEGEPLQDDVTFTHEQEHTAHARYCSTVEFWNRVDPVEGGVSVQLIACDDVIAETFIG